MAPRAAPTPQDEEQRIAAVRRYDVLDTPPDGAFDRITALAASHFKVPIAIVSIVDRDRIWFKSHHGLEEQETGRDPGLCASAILQNEPWIVEDAPGDPRALSNPLVAGACGLRFYAAVPLTTRDGFSLGTLCIIDREPRRLSEEDTATLRDMAAIVMDQLELRLAARTVVEREHALRDHAERTARSLQESLLPSVLPTIEGADVATFYRPADASEVGGDFYDVFELDSGDWALVVGDVSGKGSGAAAVTALARNAVRTAFLFTEDPREVLVTLNRAMFLGSRDVEPEHFCTASVSVLSRGPGGLALSTAAAGHPPALLLRHSGECTPITASGPPVGWFADASFQTVETALGGEDVLLVYTDGLSEARRDGRLLGEEGIVSALEGLGGDASAKAIASELVRTLSAPEVEVRDDAAAVVVKVFE